MADDTATNARIDDKEDITVNDCQVPTQTELTNCDINYSDQLSDLRICTSTKKGTRFIDVYDDEKGNKNHYKQIGHCWETGVIGWKAVFEPRGAHDHLFKLDSISGQAYSIFLSTSTSDDFSDGFDPGSAQQPAFESMVGQYGKTTTNIVGELPGTVLSTTTPTFEFNTKTPVPQDISDEIKNWVPPTNIPKGLLRIAVQHIDYHFMLNANSQTIRLYINHPVYNMATKSFKGTDGQFYFVDISDPQNPVAKVNYTDCVKPLSFWNQPHHDSPDQEEDIAAEEYKKFFKLFVIGLPIDLVDRDIDLEKLKTEEIGINLITDPTIAMRDSKTVGWKGKVWSEAELDAEREWMAIQFDIPGLNFKGLIY